MSAQRGKRVRPAFVEHAATLVPPDTVHAQLQALANAEVAAYLSIL